MKRIYTLTASALLLLATALTACDSKKADTEKSEATTPTEAKAEEAVSEKTSDASITATPTEESTIPAEENTAADDEPVSHKSKADAVYMGVWGSVGGTGFMFDMNGTTGSYIPYDMGEAKEYGARRQLKLVSYNPKNGKCIINAFLKGKYIGQFDGVFEEANLVDDEGGEHYYQAYNGLFKSINGDKLKFHFHFD